MWAPKAQVTSLVAVHWQCIGSASPVVPSGPPSQALRSAEAAVQLDPNWLPAKATQRPQGAAFYGTPTSISGCTRCQVKFVQLCQLVVGLSVYPKIYRSLIVPVF